MDFKSQFQDTEVESGFELLDSGEYEAEITNCSLDTTKEPNRFKIELTVVGEPYNGRKGWLNYNLEGRGIGFLKKDLETLGLDHSNIDSPESIVDLVAPVLNARVVVFVNQKPYNGKTYNNFYLNSLVDVPAALDNPPPVKEKPVPASKPAVAAKPAQPTAKPAAVKAKPKPTAKKPPVQAGSEPDFSDSDEVPW